MKFFNESCKLNRRYPTERESDCVLKPRQLTSCLLAIQILLAVSHNLFPPTKTGGRRHVVWFVDNMRYGTETAALN